MGTSLIWRYRRYEVRPERAEAFNTFFRDHLLPVQRDYGAILVGRWQSEDRTQIIAIWAYGSRAHYEAIQGRVTADPRSVEAQRLRRAMPEPLFTAMEEWFMDSTVALDQTALPHLADMDSPLDDAP